jgi:hypothetical protein
MARAWIATFRAFFLNDEFDKAGEFIDGGRNIGLLAAKLFNPLATFGDRNATLFGAAIVHIVQVNHVANFSEAETDILGPHDPGQTGTVPFGIYAGKAHAGRRDQSLIFVKAQCTGRYTKLVRQVRDGELVALERIRLFKVTSVVASRGVMLV